MIKSKVLVLGKKLLLARSHVSFRIICTCFRVLDLEAEHFVKQRFQYDRPLVAGDDVVATLRVTKIQSLGGHTMVTSQSSIATTSCEPVVVATSTLVIRGDEG